MSRRLLERTRFPTSLQHSGLGTGAARRLEETKDIDVGEVCGGTSGAVRISPSGPRGHVDQIVKNGTQGRYQRYLCKLCGVQFRERDLIRSRARFPNRQVGWAVKRYFEGLTYREAAEDVGHVFGTEPPDQTSVRLLGPRAY